MANLNYLESGWSDTEPYLLYVSFQINNQAFKWYPKWEDIGDLIDSCCATEQSFHSNKHSNYFKALFLDRLIRFLLDEIPIKSEAVHALNSAIDVLRKEALR